MIETSSLRPGPGPGPGSRLLPALGLVVMALTLLPPAAFLALGFVFDHAVLAMFCDTGHCAPARQVSIGAGIPVLMALAVGLLAAMIAVPHRGRLRWLRGAMLVALTAVSVAAEAGVFAAYGRG
jgi:hypothetical protein